MRFLGNKASIVSSIEDFLREKALLQHGYRFFDAFCGTGSVADHFKRYYHLIINDNLNWAVVYTAGRLCAPLCTFSALGFDPVSFLNASKEVRHDFIYCQYAPTETKRMYFTPENAERIDFFRWQIEQWKRLDLLNDSEYRYLLACLIETVSFVSNTAGVYGAFLKKWDARATKQVTFLTVDANADLPNAIDLLNAKTEDVIADVDCDILYLDPPYTQNQYGTQYHLLETLILDDHPDVSKITGSRKTAPMRSDWSKDVKAHILFDRTIATTKAKYIVCSYNNDGFMSRQYIEAVLKRYGKPETFDCRKISYKKYQNWKSCNENEHFESLYFIEKKPSSEVIYESPLNYIGSKARVVSQIKAHMPAHTATFLDAFGGGFNVGVNINSDVVIYNDINFFVKDLIESFQKYDTYEYIQFFRRMVSKFGLEKANAEAYQKAREYYNSFPVEKRDPRLLFTIIMYGYQQQIRFNSKYEFNNPIGMRWLNDYVLEKVISFSRQIKEKNCRFCCRSYLELENEIQEGTFVYADPPYMLTNGAYNDGKRGFNGWNKTLEAELLSFLDRLSARNIPFILSYVMEHKGSQNYELLQWIQEHHYNVIELGGVLGISGSRRKEILITNDDVQREALFCRQGKFTEVAANGYLFPGCCYR